jgi:GTP cyclohydrolase I
MLMNTLPDIACELKAETSSPLQWVGMEEIAVPISVRLSSNKLQTIPAKANVFVSLDTPDAKGIHMSRLHKTINKLAELECNKDNVEHLLNSLIESQLGISHQSKIELTFDLMLNKPALLSDESGYQSYPVTLKAEKSDQGLHCQFSITIPYSSTCPCSASLARQLYASAIDEEFPGLAIDKATLMQWVQSQSGSIATPHSQRSYAYLHFALGNNDWPDLSWFIFELEKAIGTPVQTAVKRSDEQAFAKLNAENLMFCEDAARRIKSALEQASFVNDYWFKVEHQESLHAHNAVVIDQKQK